MQLCVCVCVDSCLLICSCVLMPPHLVMSPHLVMTLHLLWSPLSPPLALCLTGSICDGSQNPLPGQAVVWEKNLILVRAKKTDFDRAHSQERPRPFGMPLSSFRDAPQFLTSTNYSMHKLSLRLVLECRWEGVSERCHRGRCLLRNTHPLRPVAY